jgi:hypothetical protein
VLVPSAPGAGSGAPRLLQGPAPAPGSGVLHLGAVDYDDHGDIRFAGTSPPGTTVRVYVDGHAIGDAPVGADGRWELAPRTPLAPGDHRLRLDALGRNGRVTARIALPFHRADVSAEAVAGGRVVVQPGNSLWRLARAAYGQGVRYTIIYQANRAQIRDPNLIYPGQVLSLPASSPASSSRSR